MANKFLNAKDVAYDKPGSVAGYYGWDYSNILPQAKSLLSGGEADHQRNMRKHVDGFLKRNYGLSYDQILAKPDNNKLSQLVNAVDYAVREEGRKQQTKGGGFLSFIKKFIGPAIGTAVGFAVPGIGPALGATLAGAAQGGIEDGPMGVLTGGLRGYALGSGASWLAGKAGFGNLAPVVDKTTSLSGGTAAAGNTSSWLSNAAGNALNAAQTGASVAGVAGAGGSGGSGNVSFITDVLKAAGTTAATALGGRLVSALVGDGGSGDSFDQADALSGNQSALINKQAAIYDELLKTGKQERAYYLQKYRPLENQLIGDARKGVDPDYEGITNTGAMAAREVGRQYDVARDSYLRGLSRRGVNVNSGERKSMDLTLAMGEAADRAGAFTRGNIEEADKRRAERKYADEMTFNRRSNTVGLGRGVNSTGINTVSQAASGAGNAASQYGQQAGELRRLGQDQAIAAGDAASSIVNAGIGLYSRLRAA